MNLGRNDPCWCRSGKKYKKCHLDSDSEMRPLLEAALPHAMAKNEEWTKTQRRLRDEFGVHVNYVSPIVWQGGKVWAIGSRLYTGRPPKETFHEFIISVLRGTLGEEWREAQAGYPDDQRHFLFRCSEEFDNWKVANARKGKPDAKGLYEGFPNGWVQYFLSLAWDVASLVNSSDLPEALVTRLRDPRAFQGARYEIAVAAIFARLDCEIRFLDEDPTLQKKARVEFIATHRPSGTEVAVEAKSRHRTGVLNQPGEADDEDPLRGDARGVRRLFVDAIKKAPKGSPFIIFIDINAPPEGGGRPGWEEPIKGWMGRLPDATPDSPDLFTALYVTNFSPHYQREDLAQGGGWLAVHPLYPAVVAPQDFIAPLERALSSYHRVPAFDEGGQVLD